jgi:hypothetical protein
MLNIIMSMILTASVANTYRYHNDADPDPTFYFDADPDPTFHSDTDPDPTSQCDTTTHFYPHLDPPMFQHDPLRLSPLHFYADPDTAFNFDADPDPAFHFDADPDPASQNDADPDPQHCSRPLGKYPSLDKSWTVPYGYRNFCQCRIRKKLLV